MKRFKANSIGARIISGILTIAMAFSACPTSAFAIDEDADVVAKTITIDEEQEQNTDSIVIEETIKDPNLTSIPENETADDQNIPEVDVPPNIKSTTDPDVSVDGTITFDHYFTEIDPNLVNTEMLVVKTSDKNIFTKNTNVVSNYDDVYVIECESIDEARFVYSYYVNKVDSITDMSQVVSIAGNTEDKADLSNLNDGEDVIANLNDIKTKDYSGYIALIDTGANADVNFSVIGDDTTDTNGHGTEMLKYIKEENPNAKVMSIKAFNGSKTDAASIYAAIQLAIKSKVSYINMSFVALDVEKNAIVKDAINDAVNAGIIIIGAAGNYNMDAKKFIPGAVDGVMTIGAANSDKTKVATSNYNALTYVVAESTSDATAKYTGNLSYNMSTEKIKDFVPSIIIFSADEITTTGNNTHDDKKAA